MSLRSRLLAVALAAILSACGGGNEQSGSAPQSRMGGVDPNLTLVSAGTSSSSPPVATSPAPGIQLDPVTGATILTNASAVEKAINDAYAPPGRKRQGDFSYQPYTPNGWIDDQFTRAWVFTFTGGSGARAYDPPTKPNPVPPTPSNVGGLDAYVVPAMPLFDRPPPYMYKWHDIELTDDWFNFLRNSMACAPACTMVIADILATAPKPAGISLGSTGRFQGLPSLGHPALDDQYYNPRNPRFPALRGTRLDVLANAIDLRAERLLAAWTALDKLIDKALSSTGRTHFQYALVADRDGTYPDVRYGAVKLKKLEVWKYGTSLDPDSRYSKTYLQSLGVSMVIESEGTKEEVLVQEKIKLIQYYTALGDLPPGNKIFK